MNLKPDEKPQSFKDLHVWQHGMENIAEGQARHTTGEFVQFISYAEGSTAELYTQLTLSFDLGFSSKKEVSDCLALIEELRKMLNGLRRKLLSRH